jgi:hypothetical protein
MSPLVKDCPRFSVSSLTPLSTLRHFPTYLQLLYQHSKQRQLSLYPLSSASLSAPDIVVTISYEIPTGYCSILISTSLLSHIFSDLQQASTMQALHSVTLLSPASPTSPSQVHIPRYVYRVHRPSAQTRYSFGEGFRSKNQTTIVHQLAILDTVSFYSASNPPSP